MDIHEVRVATKVVVLATLTLCFVVVSMVIALLFALYDHRVENSEIFAIISPAFNTVIGALVGAIAGVKLGSSIKVEPKEDSDELRESS